MKIYWYPAPILLHAKHISVDDHIAVIGSSNLDIRSFQLNLEVTLVDARVVAEMRRIEEGYLHKFRQVLLGDWQTRSAWEKLHPLPSSIIGRCIPAIEKATTNR